MLFNIKGVEDGDSGNDEPADPFYNGFRPIQDVLLDPSGGRVAPSQDLARRLQLLSEMAVPRPQSFDSDSDHFQELPPEGMCLLPSVVLIITFIYYYFCLVLLTVFSYLDDFSLWCVSKVCTRWDQLLRSHIPQTTWHRLVDNCWPLYLPFKTIEDWHFVCSEL